MINTDFSSFFSQGSSAMGSGINLSDYASIKNGSYGKVLKAYYAKNPDKTKPGSSNSDASPTTESAKNLATVKKDSSELKSSADALLDRSSKSLFHKKDITTKDKDGKETTVNDYDKDAIYKGVKSFIDDYNALLDSAGKSTSTKVLKQVANMTSYTKANAKLLSQAGLTIGKDNKLSVDENSLKKANIVTLKSLFNNTGSFADSIASKASQTSKYAANEAGKANTYNQNGYYGSNANSGSIFNNFF